MEHAHFHPTETNMPVKHNADLNVLLVDDDSFTLEFVTALLRDLGIFTVTTAANGRQGMDAFDRARAKPNLVLCDMNMPGANGFHMMEELAHRRYTGGVILISGEEELILYSAAQMGQMHQLNILGALPKPVTGEALTHALNGFGQTIQ
jgi:CheY-like chemotaxis protein